MEEIWRDIPDYENIYQVSNLGRVKSLERYVDAYIKNQEKCLKKEKILKGSYDGKGYVMVRLYKDGIIKTKKVHRLVAQAFLENPNGLPQINHKNEIRTDNRLENLEWCDSKYNNNYGNHKIFGTKKIIQYDKDGNVIRIYDSINEASATTNVIATGIGKCCNRKQLTAGNYVWKFYKKEDELCN